MTEPQGGALSSQELPTSLTAPGQADAQLQAAAKSDALALTGSSGNSRCLQHCTQT